MSGGSFDYLYRKTVDELYDQTSTEDYNRMIADLDVFCPQAAASMRHIWSTIQNTMRDAEKQWSELAPLLKVVEWYRSGDGNENDVVDKALSFQAAWRDIDENKREEIVTASINDLITQVKNSIKIFETALENLEGDIQSGHYSY